MFIFESAKKNLKKYTGAPFELSLPERRIGGDPSMAKQVLPN